MHYLGKADGYEDTIVMSFENNRWVEQGIPKESPITESTLIMVYEKWGHFSGALLNPGIYGLVF